MIPTIAILGSLGVLLGMDSADAPQGIEQSGPATLRPTGDTCFAILFLKRATCLLVASTDRFRPNR